MKKENRNCSLFVVYIFFLTYYIIFKFHIIYIHIYMLYNKFLYTKYIITFVNKVNIFPSIKKDIIYMWKRERHINIVL